ncbi:MAG TPA: NAD-dependent epimerase/dehydratase family protein [Candidatus Nanoarchaeia archaeon]|nr:NAD-dependent epimerase/dehydratase family protein [Candidatus Nanoarchaeia archaeon]
MEKILVKNHTTIKETMRAIDRGGIHIAIVVDNGKLIGVISDGDIRRGILRGMNIDEPITSIVNIKPTVGVEGTSDFEIRSLLQLDKISGFPLPIVDSENRVKDIALIKNSQLIYYNRTTVQHQQHNKILVIGGGGYIGSILVRTLLQRGYKVNVLDKFIYGKDSLADIENTKLQIIEGDTRHIEDMTHALQDVDAVVHLAEVVGDPACAADPSFAQESNYLATKMIADICKYFQINRFVYASSCSVYGASKDKLITESSAVAPISLYGKLKVAAENGLTEMMDENFSPTILRLSTVFGMSHRPRFDLVVNLLTAQAVSQGEITIFGGDQWRPNVHVSDVAETITALLECPIEDVGGKIFNVGSEENNHTITEIGELIKTAVPSVSIIMDKSQIDRRDYRVSFDLLHRTIKIKMKSVEYGINEVKEAITSGKIKDYTHIRYNNYKFLTK